MYNWQMAEQHGLFILTSINKNRKWNLAHLLKPGQRKLNSEVNVKSIEVLKPTGPFFQILILPPNGSYVYWLK